MRTKALVYDRLPRNVGGADGPNLSAALLGGPPGRCSILVAIDRNRRSRCLGMCEKDPMGIDLAIHDLNNSNRG